MHIDSKHTLWYRTFIPESLQAEVTKLLYEGKDVYQIQEFIRESEEFCDGEWDYNTVEDMCIEENNYYSTLEFFDDEGYTTFKNADDSVILNPDKKLVEGIMKALCKNGGYCPCFQGDVPKEDTFCPCKSFREEKKCHCNLYINVDKREE